MERVTEVATRWVLDNVREAEGDRGDRLGRNNERKVVEEGTVK